MMLCYTSGTTGHPKGVAYTQRSTYLHTIHGLATLPITPDDAVLPVQGEGWLAKQGANR